MKPRLHCQADIGPAAADLRQIVTADAPRLVVIAALAAAIELSTTALRRIVRPVEAAIVRGHVQAVRS